MRFLTEIRATALGVSGALSLGMLANVYGALPKNVTFVDAFEGKATFDSPVGMFEVPGKKGTFVVLEQHTGDAVVLTKTNNTWTKSVLVHVDVGQADETGLLGLAFHPQFVTNRKYYLSYNPNTSTSRVEEREADATYIKDSGKAPKILFDFAQPASNHNGGTIGFGPKDGYLYLGFGDGGGGGDTYKNSRKKNVLFAKMLRIDVNKAENGKNYGIPADNPFVGQSDFLPEIWAWGFRNPWKWSFDPVNGDLWVGDVGQVAREEVNFVEKGKDYGWVTMEGKQCYGETNCEQAGLTLPILDYPRGTGTSITGGYVFRGNSSSPFYGAYFYADYGSSGVWSVMVANGKVTDSIKVGTLEEKPTSFATDTDGLLYVMGRAGHVYRLESPDLKSSGVPVKQLQNKKTMGCCFNKVGSRWLAKSTSSIQTPDAVEVLGLDGSVKQSFDSKTLATGIAFDIQPGLYLVRSKFKSENQSRTIFFN